MKGIFRLTAAALLACLPLLGPVQGACAEEWTPSKVAELQARADAGDAQAQERF